MNNEPYVIERTYDAPLARVWEAITDAAQMKFWYFDIPDFKPVVGTDFSFTGKGNEGQEYVHLCTVTEVVPQRKLTHSWRYEGYEGNSFVTFELFPEGEKTTLRLTHEGLHTFPAIPAFAKENFNQGWTAIIGTSLKSFLEGDTTKP